MDLRTGRTYATIDEALADGVPPSDLVQVEETPRGPDVKVITNGPFKGRIYKRNARGQMERVK